MKRDRIIISILLSAVLLLGTAGGAWADDLSLETPVYIDGLLSARGRLLGGEAYIAPSTLSEYLKIPMDIIDSGEHLSIDLPGVLVEGEKGQQYIRADGRYIYAPNGWISDGGELYLPASAVGRIFGVEISERADGGVEVDTEGYRLIRGGENYYELNFDYGDLYWMTQIIFSEANLEPLEGKIAVGNVVMNRVRSSDYPDDIFSVLFEIGKVIQFEPVSNGRIHDESNEISFIAACLCLEGTDVINDPDCLFFVSVDTNITWFQNRLEFVKTIGRHDFYRTKKG